MLWRLISPIGFPLFFLAGAWFMERYASPDHKAPRKKMRWWFVISFLIACSRYAETWHNEIGLAWQKHPSLTEFLTFVVFLITLFAISPLLSNRIPTSAASPPAPSRRARENI
jgi:hypothetical protein